MSSVRRIIGVAWPLALLVAFGATFRRVPATASAAVETIDCSVSPEGPPKGGHYVPPEHDSHVVSGFSRTDLATLERCVALDPANVELMIDLAAAYESSHQPDKAEAIYQRALTVDARDGDLHVRLGELLLKRGERAGARAEAERALVWHPNSAKARDLATRASAPEADR